MKIIDVAFKNFAKSSRFYVDSYEVKEGCLFLHNMTVTKEELPEDDQNAQYIEKDTTMVYPLSSINAFLLKNDNKASKYVKG